MIIIGLAQQHSLTVMSIQMNPPHSKLRQQLSASMFSEKHSPSRQFEKKRGKDSCIAQFTQDVHQQNSHMHTRVTSPEVSN
jgi:hypothetical protein